MGHSSCDVCEKCGSTLGYSPNSHPEPTPHQVRAVIRNGKLEGRCDRCLQSRPLSEATNLLAIRDAIDGMDVQLVDALQGD
jgi:hypothetical protein